MNTPCNINFHMLIVFCRNSTKKERRFLVIDISQLIMVEPDASRLGWGVVRFSGYLQVCINISINLVYNNIIVIFLNSDSVCLRR
mgnify:CR=1 FL=1